MKSEKRKSRLAELLGIDGPPPPPTKEELIARGTISREAEAVLAYASGEIKFVQRECKQCGFVFAVNRTSIAYCSDTCRQHAMLSDWKIVWDPNSRSPEERWSAQAGGAEPLIVPPSALPLIQAAMEEKQKIIQETLQGQQIEELSELLDLIPDVSFLPE